MKFKDIQQLTHAGAYNINVPLSMLEKNLEGFFEMGLQLCPDFQRGYVWTEEQQSKYVEFLLRGGKSSRVIYFNCPFWFKDVKDGDYSDFVCVDGLQRLTAIRAFLNNQIPAFNTLYKDYEDNISYLTDVIFNVNDLKTKSEVLQWYIEMNSGGTPHSEKEIARVKQLLEEAKKNGE